MAFLRHLLQSLFAIVSSLLEGLLYFVILAVNRPDIALHFVIRTTNKIYRQFIDDMDELLPYHGQWHVTIKVIL